MSRYWFTLRAPDYWYGGWCFGDTPELAAADALTHAQRWHPPTTTELTCHLQLVPNYSDHVTQTQYHTVQLGA